MKKNESQAARAVSKSCNCGAKGPSFEPRTLLSSIKILEQKRALNGLEETSPEDCDETLAWCEEIIRMAFLSIIDNFRKTKSSSSSFFNFMQSRLGRKFKLHSPLIGHCSLYGTYKAFNSDVVFWAEKHTSSILLPWYLVCFRPLQIIGLFGHVWLITPMRSGSNSILMLLKPPNSRMATKRRYQKN